MGHNKFIAINICQNQILYKILKLIEIIYSLRVNIYIIIQIIGFGSHYQFSNVKISRNVHIYPCYPALFLIYLLNVFLLTTPMCTHSCKYACKPIFSIKS